MFLREINCKSLNTFWIRMFKIGVHSKFPEGTSYFFTLEKSIFSLKRACVNVPFYRDRLLSLPPNKKEHGTRAFYFHFMTPQKFLVESFLSK